MTDTPALTADQLVRHEAFVQAIARALLGDEARAQDVVQETWLTALRRSPDRAGSTRAWLGRVARNLALDDRRSAQRRATREQLVARAEAIESVDESYARLSVQRDVVDAVLGLREPYRSVVMLRFFQELDANAVAERLGRSAATVRSQQSRALGLLRESLDGKYGGDEALWVSVLLPLAATGQATKSVGLTSLASPAVIAVLATAVGCAGLLFALRVQAPDSIPPVLHASSIAPPPQSPDPVPAVGAVALATTPAIERRTALEAPAQDANDVSGPQSLDGRTIEELRELAAQTQAAIEAELLTPDPAIVAAETGWTDLPDTGICRMVDRSFADANLGGALVTRGAGAYYSFANRDHSYDASPDLEYQSGYFSSGFYGISIGLVAWIGDLPLDALPTSATPIPSAIPESQRAAWETLWRPISEADAAHNSTFREETSAFQRRVKRTTAPMTYIVRACLQNEHDHLVAFRVLDDDEHTVTLGWRILHTWPTPGDRPRGAGTQRNRKETPVVPDWLAELSLAQLMQRLSLIRDQAAPLLFDVPDELRAQHAGLVDDAVPTRGSTSGFSRILHRGEWSGLTSMREGGAYYSFSTGSNAFDGVSDLCLEQYRLSVVQSGHLSSLIDLGAIPAAGLRSVLTGTAPPGLDEQTKAAWDFLHTVQADPSLTDQWGRRSLSEQDAARAKELGMNHRGANAAVGHVYLMRTMLSQHADQLVVFAVIGENAAGYSLAWRVLRTWPVPLLPQGR